MTNSYRGGVYQQALSHLAYVDDTGFTDGGGEFAVYGESCLACSLPSIFSAISFEVGRS